MKNRFSPWFRLLAIATLFWVGLLNSIADNPKSEWSQWRGPNRNGISHETDFLKNWPDKGPKVLWRIPLGKGYSGISVSQRRAYTMFDEEGDEFVICLDALNGEEIWRFRTSDSFKGAQGVKGPRSTPAVDGNSVFALSPYGKLYALRVDNGEKLWMCDLKERFGGTSPKSGFSMSPLVDGTLLLIEAGGSDGKSIVALDKNTGSMLWTSYTDIPAYSSPISVKVNGKKQFIFLTGTKVVSVSPTDGAVYWEYPWQTPNDINAATPVFIPPDKIFVSSNYDKGAVVLRIKVTVNELTVREVWKSQVMRNHFSSSIFYKGYLYGFDNDILKCIEAYAGKEQWQQTGFGRGSLILADGHLIILSEMGKLALAEATPSGYEDKASAKILKGRCLTVPTLADGRLYLRNLKEMVCLDLRKQ